MDGSRLYYFEAWMQPLHNSASQQHYEDFFSFFGLLLVSLVWLDTKAPELKDYPHAIYLHLLGPSWLQESTGVQKAVLCIEVHV